MAIPDQLRPRDVGGQVAITEQEPGLAGIPPQHVQRVIGISLDAPALLLVDQSGQRVHHDVDIWRHPQTVERGVIPGVDDSNNLRRLDNGNQALKKPSRPDPAGKCGNHRRPAERALELGPSTVSRQSTIDPSSRRTCSRFRLARPS